MKIRVADYIAEFLVENNIDTLFSVVGGGAMHLNDGFGHNKNLNCIYNHHEQACAIAAEAVLRSALADSDLISNSRRLSSSSLIPHS